MRCFVMPAKNAPSRAPHLTPGVVLRVQGFEAFARDMGVDGRGRNIGMPQQHLHRAQICTVVEQMRGKSVAQGVG